MDKLQAELLEDLTIDIEGDDAFDSSKLEQKIKNAIRDVQRARNYPDSYTEEQITKDMERLYSKIRAIALYDYNLIGAEGELEHSENGIGRTYVDRNSLFNGILPLSRI